MSYYHHNRLFKSFDFDSEFLAFADLFKNSNISTGQVLIRRSRLKGFAVSGGYFQMLESGWKRRDHPNMLLFWYEQIKHDQKFWIKTILKHVDYALSEQKIDELCEALTFRCDEIYHFIIISMTFLLLLTVTTRRSPQ